MFCPNCGTQIPDDSAFCENCGTKIAAAAQQDPQQSPYQQTQAAQQQWQQYAPQDGGAHRMSVRTASLLCYWFSFVGWCISYFLADNKDPYLRFHLNQSLILWIAGIIVSTLSNARGLSIIGGLLALVYFVLWLMAFIGSCRGQMKAPFLLDKIPPILK